MRLVIDLQGAQGSSYARGIGRYSRELAYAMAAAPRGHEVIIALNAVLAEPAAELAARFADLLPRENIRLWHPPPNVATALQTPLRGIAETIRAQFLASLQPDLVHMTSLYEGLGDDVITLQPPRLQRLPVVATCYDLIPLVRHNEYFGDAGPLSQAAIWYYRCAHEMAMSDGLLAISEFSRGEAIRHLSFDPEKIFDIQSGISPDFRPVRLGAAERAALLRRYGLRGDFILFLGAGDIRKNEAGLIAAYARLPPGLRDSHQLLIVGKMDPAAFYETARSLEVPADDFVIAPFVPEGDLNALYSACTLFVFPSLHEGFGLPVAEAMACGAPVIASNTTSLPEVIGRDDATFDPRDPDAIADCMREVLENPALRQDLAQWGPIQAARFTWPSSAARAWNALEAIHAARQEKDRPRRHALLSVRPSLAFVSPFPPQASGVADYSHDLVFVLARHYDITLVSEAEIAEPRLAGAFTLLRPEEFLAAAGGFDRVIYQIGNSEFHHFQLETLLAQCPGVVVLHDTFLSDYANWRAHTQGDPNKFLTTLLHSHGYPALRYEAVHGYEAARAKYPCNLAVLQAAIGVIQHSVHATEILQHFYGEQACRSIEIIPLLRVARPERERQFARALLELDPDAFILCSFGGVHATKCPDVITQAWRRAGLAGKLVFVGGAPPDLMEELNDAAAGIFCTGRVTAEDYELWLAAADLAVQWRTGSRGESSAAIADVLISGLPLIFNRHGSAAELPEHVGLGLPDEAGADALAQAILTLHDDPDRRRALSAAGQAYALRGLAPDLAAKRYYEAIEQAYARPLDATAAMRFGRELRVAAALPHGPAEIAKSLTRSFCAPWRTGGMPRLLIDISELADPGPALGFRQVLRELGRRVLEASPKPYRGVAIRAGHGLIVETFAEPLRMLGHPPLALAECPLDAGQGDILICTDQNAALTGMEFAELRRLQLGGTRIILIVHELQSIGPNAAWYARMLGIADGVACTSNAAAQTLLAWLNENQPRRGKLPVGIFPLGADAVWEEIAEPEAAEEAQIPPNPSLPTILLAGATLPEELAQVLQAFELLWRDDVRLGLTIIGDPAGLPVRLETSPEWNKRLHWQADDAEPALRRLYRTGAGLLAASHAGGSLPILNAAAACLPILARDLPASREIAGGHARYFMGDSAEALAAALRDWQAAAFAPSPAGLELPSWDESYRRLCTLILEESWPILWRPD